MAHFGTLISHQMKKRAKARRASAKLVSASLQWGGHRREFGLEEHVREEILLRSSEIIDYIDPVLSRPQTVLRDSVWYFQLNDVVFVPTKQGVLLASGIALRESMRQPTDLRWFPKVLDTVEQHTGTDFIPMNLSRNYYHFMFEDVPRLLMLKSQGKSFEVMTGHGLLPFHREVLEFLDIRARVVRNPIALSRCHFVSIPQPGFEPSPIPLRKALRGLSSPEGASSGERIYVSRRNSTRSSRFEDDIESGLERRDFRVIHAERLSVADQIQIFSRAKTIVAPHGAGLTNILFLSPGSRLIELMNVDYANPCYQILANGLGLEYSFLLTEEDEPGHSVLRRIDSCLLEAAE